MSSRRIEFRVSFEAGGSLRHYAIQADPDARVRDLRLALAEHADVAAPAELFNLRSGPMPDDRRLGAGGLRDGDVLAGDPKPLPETSSRPGVDLEVAVVGGPSAGRRFTLPAGTVTIGRDPSCDLMIDDPSLSRQHARLTVTSAGVQVSDAGSQNGTAVEGRRLSEGEERLIGPNDHVEVGRSLLNVRPRARTDATVTTDRATVVEFNRPPRFRPPYTPPVLEVAAPPTRPGGPRLPLAASFAPLVLGVVMFLVIKQPAMLLFSALSPVMAVSTYISDRRGGRKSYNTQLRGFHNRAETLRTELAEMRDAEAAARRAEWPDPAVVVARAERHLPELWERRPADPDFLSLRLGTADQPSDFTVKFAQGGDPAERQAVEEDIAQSTSLASMPIALPLGDVGAVGLSGPPASVDALARWLVLQAAVLHSPRDLVVLAALSERRASDWEWLAWIPHAEANRTIVDHANVAVGEHQASGLLRAVAEAIDARRSELEERFSARARAKASLLLVIDEDVAPARALVDDLLSDAHETGLAIVWLGRDRRDLPGGCGAIVGLSEQSAAMEIMWPGEGRVVSDATADGIAVEVADGAARGLAPVRDVTATGAAGALPRSVPLLELLDLDDLTSATVEERWRAANGDGLPAPIGRSADGVFTIDLRHDGPHGLVAGTTGAGKSELLQSLVAGMALSQPPDKVTFLFVDYKGGAAFKDCARLPHTVGMVTDLDAHLTRRALISLNAELRRREEILNRAGVKDLLELERRDPQNAPPSLVIIVDEFAALKSEVPEFVDGVVDIAQRGRSLGVHLILATQRPGGVVSENIRANTNLRVALRVQNTTESDDVIGDRAAARISKSLPGRAYARTGHSELTEFQSAFVGGVSGGREADSPVTVADLELGGAATRERDEPEASGASDLERIVEAVTGAWERGGLAPPLRPWLPELDELISIDDLASEATEPYVVPIGVIDDPAHQRRLVDEVDLQRDGNLFIYGTSGAGKTSLLRTIAIQLARRSDPRHLHIYALDFAGRGLTAIEGLPHCGSVIADEDEERVTRLFSMLRREIDERGRLFAEHGVTTLAEFHAKAPEDRWPPRIVVLLDSYSGFTSAFDSVSLGALTQALPRIIADGRAAGVHVIATADRRMAVPNAVASLITRRVILRLADEDEYATFGLDRRAVQGAVLPPGRGFVDDTLEMQTAVVGRGVGGEGLAAATREEVERLRGHFPDAGAPGIQTMPSDVPRADLPRSEDAARPILGVEELDFRPIEADVRESAFFISGPYKSGRTTALQVLALGVKEADPNVESYALVPRRSVLAQMDGFTAVARGTDACAELARQLADVVLARSQDTSHPLLAIFIDDADELADGAAAASLESIVRRGRDVNVRVFASCEAVQARGFSAFLRELRKDGNGLLLEPNVDMDGDLLGVRLPRRANRVFPPGRGYLVRDGQPTLVQVAAVERLAPV